MIGRRIGSKKVLNLSGDIGLRILVLPFQFLNERKLCKTHLKRDNVKCQAKRRNP